MDVPEDLAKILLNFPSCYHIAEQLFTKPNEVTSDDLLRKAILFRETFGLAGNEVIESLIAGLRVSEENFSPSYKQMAFLFSFSIH